MQSPLDFEIYHDYYGAHAHSYPQILIPLEQTMQLSIADETYEVTPQELCFIPAGLTHCCDFSGPLQVINIVHEPIEWRNTLMLASPLIVRMRDQITRLVELIQAELRQDPNSKSIHYLYSYLYGRLLESCAAPSIRYLSEHYHLPITVGELARIESYNATYYSEWFKQQTGFSPIFYLRHLRISRAKELLAATNYSVMDIAVMVGYSSNCTFTRAFHSITGMTPKAYRKAQTGT